MRDSLLDYFVEPMVQRMGLDPAQASYTAARLYGAFLIGSSSALFDQENGLWFDVSMQILISVALTKILMLAGRIGPSLLDTPLGYAHFAFRMLFLIFFVWGACNVIAGLSVGLIEPSYDLLWQSVSITGIGLACASMYLGACRTGRPSGGIA